MSKNAGGYMGIQIGKLGPAVGQMWKGKNVYRSHNPFPKDPKTPQQKAIRTRFGFINSLTRALSPAINAGFLFEANSQRTTTRGLFVHENFPLVTLSSETGTLTPTIDYSQIKVAVGGLTPVSFGTPSHSDGAIQVPITSSLSGIGNALDDDNVNVILFNPSMRQAVMTSAKRTATSILIPLPESWPAGTQLHLYGFTTTAVTEPTFVQAYNGNVYPFMSSDSHYLGALTLP